MDVMLGPQPLVRPVYALIERENMETEECEDRMIREDSMESMEGAEYEHKDYMEIQYASPKSPCSGDEGRMQGGNYRAELKRPDLKGSFRCSICSKVFCHSSSLSRHRMQAHFKSYKCTLCRKDITKALDAPEDINVASDDPRRKKKPYKELTLQEKVQLIRLAEENAGMSQASIADKYKIAKSNVCRILQRKKEYLMAFETAGFAGSRKRKLKGSEGVDTPWPSKDSPTSQIQMTPNPPTAMRFGYEGNETLRAHMYKQHEISRMFMCRCCNWAFPDKTSLHLHIQAREEGKNVSVSVIGKGIAPPQVGEHSAFTPLSNIQNNNNNNNSGAALTPLPTGVLAPAPLSFFPPPTTPLPTTQEDFSRLRERLMLNSLISQPGFGFAAAWLNNLPKPIPTTKPHLDLSLLSEKREEEEINVDKDVDDSPNVEDVKPNVSVIDSFEDKLETKVNDKRSPTPSENGCSSSTDGSSPAHTSSAHSPNDIFKKTDGSRSAFHHLNVDSRPFQENAPSSHVSPAETHSSISPDGSCYDCNAYKNKLTILENRCRYMESRSNTLQTEAVLAQQQLAQNETAARNLEVESRTLRQHNDILHRRLLECQEQALRFVQTDRISNPQAVMMFMNQLIQSTIIR